MTYTTQELAMLNFTQSYLAGVETDRLLAAGMADVRTYRNTGRRGTTDLYAWLKPSHCVPPVAEARPLNPWDVAYDRESDPRFARSH